MISNSRFSQSLLIAAGVCLASLTAGGVWALRAVPRSGASDPSIPRGYVCYRTDAPLNIDGKLDENAWSRVPWTEDFVDIEGSKKPAPRFRTRAKMLWDDQYFYIGAQLEEPHIWATLNKHDSVIFRDNDFEVFIDPDGDNHNYAEFEMNALNTGWDLLLTRPYKDGGKALNSWEIPGLKTAVHVDGTLNQANDHDRSWTVELAFPWKALSELAAHRGPPRDGEQWRVNFSRVEWQIDVVDGRYRKVPDKLEDNWVWSPQGVVDMHRPETWGYVQFSTAPVGKSVFQSDIDGPTKRRLHEVYYAERAFHKKNGRWARTIEELGPLPESAAGAPKLLLEANQFGFTASLPSLDKTAPNRTWQIRQDALLWMLPEKIEKEDSEP
jgi:hypothetical protein